jgi:uncharacterized membrane protein YhaH (DUF805 family)
MTMWQTLFGVSGRIGRGAFWLLMIAVLLLDLAVVALVSDWIHSEYLGAGAPHRPGGSLVGAGFGLLVVAVISGWSFIALQVKRAHDLGRSGWWLLIGLIPVYGVVRLIYELGFLPGSPRRNAYGEAPSYIGDEDAPLNEGPQLTVWTATEPPETPFARHEPRLQPPPPDLPIDGPIHPVAHEPQDLDLAAHVEEPHEAELSEPAPPSAESEVEESAAAGKPEFVHPIMDWGKSYQADLNWPEFEDHPSSFQEHVPDALKGLDERPLAMETLSAPLHQPAMFPPLAWTPAPSHEAYAELGPLTLQPANDPHERF